MLRAIVLTFAALIALAVLYVYFTYLRRKTPDELVEALRAEIAPKGGVLLRSDQVAGGLGLYAVDCKVYRFWDQDGKLGREEVLRTGFYLGFTTCTGQSLAMVDGHFVAKLSNQAIGAGGGNISGGAYWSKDGVSWEQR